MVFVLLSLILAAVMPYADSHRNDKANEGKTTNEKTLDSALPLLPAKPLEKSEGNQ